MQETSPTPQSSQELPTACHEMGVRSRGDSAKSTGFLHNGVRFRETCLCPDLDVLDDRYVLRKVGQLAIFLTSLTRQMLPPRVHGVELRRGTCCYLLGMLISLHVVVFLSKAPLASNTAPISPYTIITISRTGSCRRRC